jgi:5'(3')-deoxyribonucleotidase
MKIKNNETYEQKLERENKLLCKQIADVEEENRKLIEEIRKFDPTFMEAQFKNLDITEELEQEVLNDLAGTKILQKAWENASTDEQLVSTKKLWDDYVAKIKF